MGATVAAKNRKVRREELRAYLAERGKLDYILDNIEKIENLDTNLDVNELNRLKTANDQRIKLLSKYLPDVKAVEVTGEEGEPIQARASIEWTVQPVKPIEQDTKG